MRQERRAKSYRRRVMLRSLQDSGVAAVESKSTVGLSQSHIIDPAPAQPRAGSCVSVW